jgi:hypothetical protein
VPSGVSTLFCAEGRCGDNNMRPAPNTEEFDRLLDRLARDIVDAAIFRRLRSDLVASFDEFSREFTQSWTFWSLSFQAYIEVALHLLSRIYVGEKRSLSIRSWLEAIKNNPKLFQTSPDPVQLDRDIDSVKDDDPIVKNLVILRNKVLAHTNWRNVAQKRVGDRFALTFKEVDALVLRASEILNRYSMLFKQTAWSPTISGHDDFRTILNALRADLERRDAERTADV